MPLLYLGTAHAALGLAFLLAAWWPRAVAGFFYHAWMVALVHLVTLGWITFSIFGAFYIVGPLALRTDMRARRMDVVAWVLGLGGLAGMVGHFWIEEYSGMAWSATPVACAVLFMTTRIAAAIWRAPIAAAVRLHVVLACVNVWLAAGMGILIAIDRATPVLPGFVLSNVFAHAHLAAVGWAVMMVVGIGYRLLPMVLPSKMPAGRSMYASAILLEAGVLGLFVTLLAHSAWSVLFGILIAAGLGVFGAHVVWMLRHPAPKPSGAPPFEFAVAHAACAGASLVAALVLGLALVVVPTSEESLHAAAAYGVLGLVGFLAQMVVAMEARLLPMVTWCWAFASNGYQVPPPPPHAMRDRRLQALVLAGWVVGVPALAAGMALESAPLVGVGAWTLLSAVGIAAIDHGWVLAHARRAAAARSTEAA
ncbi:MAG: hypothetical protein A3G77_04835 [Acidobacteria bacterium RIFCSPLOWO2_12_FULL_68_19]|nr:MAG: hypothetical protein A3G77_04835 [Acidobacteria bacterium RIFCSPLOWO2_12_FULL_68_19]